jgi:hypothetical protein
VFVRGVRLVDVHHHCPLEVGDRAGYGVQTLEPSHVAGQWRKLSPSAELMVGPDCGARCAIRDTGAPGEGRYRWTVTAFGEPDPVAAGRTGEIGMHVRRPRQPSQAARENHAITCLPSRCAMQSPSHPRRRLILPDLEHATRRLDLGAGAPPSDESARERRIREV